MTYQKLLQKFWAKANNLLDYTILYHFFFIIIYPLTLQNVTCRSLFWSLSTVGVLMILIRGPP